MKNILFCLIAILTTSPAHANFCNALEANVENAISDIHFYSDRIIKEKKGRFQNLKELCEDFSDLRESASELQSCLLDDIEESHKLDGESWDYMYSLYEHGGGRFDEQALDLACHNSTAFLLKKPSVVDYLFATETLLRAQRAIKYSRDPQQKLNPLKQKIDEVMKTWKSVAEAIGNTKKESKQQK